MDSAATDHGSKAGAKALQFHCFSQYEDFALGRAISLKDLKPGEHLNILAQPAPDGRFLTVSLSTAKPRGYPVATAVPGKPGWVYSPYAPAAGPVNVSGVPPGTEVRCPYTKKFFFTPF